MVGQEQLAVEVHLGFKSNSYVSQVENGEFIPSDDKMVVWAEMLGLSDEEIENLKLDKQSINLKANKK